MKHGEGKEIAHDLYVYQQMTFEEIAQRTGRSEKTIRTWADEGDWKGERERDIQARQSVHEKLHVLVEKITDRMIRDCQGDTDLSPQSLHALTNLIAAMNRSYQYEKTTDDDVETHGRASLSGADISAKIREILGA